MQNTVCTPWPLLDAGRFATMPLLSSISPVRLVATSESRIDVSYENANDGFEEYLRLHSVEDYFGRP
jgi:hypothetical protein